MDVDCAFLNSEVKSEVFIEQPEGFHDGTDRVYLLNNSLYPLKEAPGNWYECFDEFIRSLGFVRCNVDNFVCISERMELFV